MTKPPEGLQDHVLWTSDGRTWIENVNRNEPTGIWLRRALDNGRARRIPMEALEDLVRITTTDNPNR